MPRLITWACAACLFSGTAHSQSISGEVTDGETGLTLPGATVVLPTLNLGTTSGPDGRYTLALPAAGSFRVIFSFVGYKTETRSVTLDAKETVRIDIVLTASFVEVGDVTVSAKAQASDILSTPQSVAIVDEDALARSAGGTPMDALDGVAGVRSLRTGPGVAKPVIRGLTSQRVLVVSDGVRQEGQSWGDEHGPEIGNADVDRIEVVRGPSSLLYGSDALGGVVHTLHTDLFASESPIGGSANVTGLSGTQQGSGDVTLGGVSGRWGYEGRLGVLRAGQVQTPGGLVPNTAQRQTTGSVRFGRRIGSNGQIMLDAGSYRSRLGLFEPEFLEDGGVLSELGRHDFAAPFQDVDHDRAGLQAEFPLQRNRLEVGAALQQNRRREFEDGEEPALYLRLTTATTDVRLHHRPIGSVFGTVGISGLWQQNESLAEETLIPGATTLNGAFYVTEELVLPTVTLDAGIRLDLRSLDADANEALGTQAQTRNYSAVTGALGVAWQPRGDLSMAANLGRAFRAPQLIELFGNGVHEGTLRFERGDATLTPEKSLALDGVVRYLTPHLYAEVSGFVNQIIDYIFPQATSEIDDESGFVIFDYVQGDARLVGGEARLDIHPHSFHGLGLHFSGDFTAGTNREKEIPLPFVPPARVRTAFEYKAQTFGPADKLEVRFGPTFTASQNRPDVPEEIPTEAFTTWDFSLSATFSTNGLTVSPVLTIDNAFDAAYVDPLSRFRPYGVLSPGRNVRLGVRVDFGG